MAAGAVVGTGGAAPAVVVAGGAAPAIAVAIGVAVGGGELGTTVAVEAGAR